MSSNSNAVAEENLPLGLDEPGQESPELSSAANQFSLEKSYDDVPYESHAFPRTHPRHLSTIAKVFGLETPDFRKSRILELGCAAGGNIVPIALQYPDSEVYGIDLSNVQIEQGQKIIEELGLKNIKLEAKSISDISKADGEFDYIICHGVWSWVPESVQADIFRIASENLSKNGVAYISYNTMPGWSMVRSLREMMLYHTRRFEDAATKVLQARTLLQFLLEAQPEQDTPYKQALKSELDILKNQPDHYLLHEHLEDFNRQVYFHEFMDMAAKENLQYVGDVVLESMFTGNLSGEAAEKLRSVGNIILSEQYMDFIRNRRFRSSILCHADVPLTRKLNAESIMDFKLTTILKSDLKAEDLKPGAQGPFVFDAITAHDLGSAWLFQTLIERARQPIDAKELVEIAAKRAGVDPSFTKTVLQKNGLNLALRGFIKLHTEVPEHAAVLSDKPKCFELARLQCKQGASRVTNTYHEATQLDNVARILMPLVDGTRTRDDLVDAVVQYAQDGTLVIRGKDGQPMKDAAQLKKEAGVFIDRMLDLMKNNAFLIG